MNEVIKRMVSKCKYLMKYSMFKDTYCEVLDILMNSKFDENTKVSILVELYKFAFYHNVSVSMDPRGDFRFKFDVLTTLKNSLNQTTIDENVKNQLVNANNEMRDKIENPIKYIQAEIKFDEENPDIKF